MSGVAGFLAGRPHSGKAEVTPPTPGDWDDEEFPSFSVEVLFIQKWAAGLI